MNGRKLRALVDIGCITTLVTLEIAEDWNGKLKITVVDGRDVDCKGISLLKLVVSGMKLNINAVVTDRMVEGIDLVMRMDTIHQLGGVLINGDRVDFRAAKYAIAVHSRKDCEVGKEKEEIVIEDQDFCAEFDGRTWTLEWYWKESSPELRNRLACYESSLKGVVKEDFEREVDKWIDEGVLVPCEKELEVGVLPLMAVLQPMKGKVMPVFDFRKVNYHVECHTDGEVVDVCGEILRKWRRMTGASKMVDLKSAYLQLKVSKSLWKYQLVRYKERTYCFTRLGFRLNSTPKIVNDFKEDIGEDEKGRWHR